MGNALSHAFGSAFPGRTIDADHFIPYFAIDLTITRAVQSNHGAVVDDLMRGVSWIGFPPQVVAQPRIIAGEER